MADVRSEDVQLEAGALTETVTVESPAVAIQTIGGEVAGLVTAALRPYGVFGNASIAMTTAGPTPTVRTSSTRARRQGRAIPDRCSLASS